MVQRFNDPEFRRLSPARKTTAQPWSSLAAIALAFASLAAPAQATVITIDVDYIQTDSNIVCQPCGPSTITFNFDSNTHLINWTFDWYGWTGMAHDAYAAAIANGADLFDLNASDPASLNDWLMDHPNGVAFSRLDNMSGPGVFDSDWTMSLYDLGVLQSMRRDLLQVGPSDGLWRTDDVQGNAYYQSHFIVTGIRDEGPGPSPVPEPGTLGLFLAAAAVGLGTKRWQRH